MQTKILFVAGLGGITLMPYAATQKSRPTGEKNVSRTTVAHLSDKDLKRLFVLNAQKTDRFNPKQTLDSLLEKIIINRLENQRLSTLRDWLLPMLMNGQVSVAGE